MEIRFWFYASLIILVCSTALGGFIIPDNGYIGSKSEPNAIRIDSSGNITMSQGLTVDTDTLIVDAVNHTIDTSFDTGVSVNLFRFINTDTNVAVDEKAGAIQWINNDQGNERVAIEISAIGEPAGAFYALVIGFPDLVTAGAPTVERFRFSGKGSFDIRDTNPASQTAQLLNVFVDRGSNSDPVVYFGNNDNVPDGHVLLLQGGANKQSSYVIRAEAGFVGSFENAFEVRGDSSTFILGPVGIGETAPETLTEWTSTVPYLTLHNSTEEDGDGGRASRINFKGEQSGGEETTLARIEVGHDGTGDDQKGYLDISINEGSDGDSPSHVVTITSNRFGIGSSSPNAPLEVKGFLPGEVGGFQSGLLHVTAADNSEFANSVITGHNSYTGNTQLWYLGSTSYLTNDIAFINRQDGFLALWTNNTERFKIEADGDITMSQDLTVDGQVIIGSVSDAPTAELTVETTSGLFAAAFFNADGSIVDIVMYDVDTTGAGFFPTLSKIGNNAILQRLGGSVLIGTLIADGKLTIVGDDAAVASGEDGDDVLSVTGGQGADGVVIDAGDSGGMTFTTLDGGEGFAGGTGGDGGNITFILGDGGAGGAGGTAGCFRVTTPGNVEFVANTIKFGDDSLAADTVLHFLSSGNDGDITYVQATDEFDFGDADITTTGIGRFDNGVGIGADPTATFPLIIHAEVNERYAIDILNTSTGEFAFSQVRVRSDSANFSMIAFGSEFLGSRWGIDLKSTVEVFSSGSPLSIGTLSTDNFILGTNSSPAITIDGSGQGITIEETLLVEGDFTAQENVFLGSDAGDIITIIGATNATGTITATGTVSGSAITDEIARLTGGNLTNIGTIGAAGDADLLTLSSGLLTVSGAITIGDGGLTNYVGISAIGDVSFNGSAGVIYGHMNIPGVDIVVDTSADGNPVEVADDGTGVPDAGDGWASSYQNGTVFAVSDLHYITVTAPGIYEVLWDMSPKTASGAGTIMHAGITIDSTTFQRDNGEGHAHIFNANDNIQINGVGTVDCPNGTEEISLWISNDQNQKTLVEHGNMRIEMIGGT